MIINKYYIALLLFFVILFSANLNVFPQSEVNESGYCVSNAKNVNIGKAKVKVKVKVRVKVDDQYTEDRKEYIPPKNFVECKEKSCETQSDNYFYDIDLDEYSKDFYWDNNLDKYEDDHLCEKYYIRIAKYDYRSDALSNTVQSGKLGIPAKFYLLGNEYIVLSKYSYDYKTVKKKRNILRYWGYPAVIKTVRE